MSQTNGYRNRLVSGRGFDRDAEYVHQDYPKLITDVNGDRVTVDSAEEEKAFQKEIDDAAKKPKKPAAPKSDGDLE